MSSSSSRVTKLAASSRSSLSSDSPDSPAIGGSNGSLKPRWSVRKRLSQSAAGRVPQSGSGDTSGVDDDLWDKNEAAFLQDVASDRATMRSFSPRMSFTSPASSHRFLQSPAAGAPTDSFHSLNHEDSSWLDPHLSMGPDLHDALGPALGLHSHPPTSSRSASNSSRPASRSSMASPPLGERIRRPSALSTSGLHANAERDAAAYSPTNRQRKSHNDDIQAAQTILPRLSGLTPGDHSRASSPIEQQIDAMESFFPSQTLDSDAGHEASAEAGPSQLKIEDVGKMSLGPSVPPKSPPLDSQDRRLMPPPPLPSASPAHPFRYRSNSVSPTDSFREAPQSSLPVPAPRGKAAVIITGSARPRNTDSDIDRGKVQKSGFLRGMRSRETSANNATLSPDAARDYSSPRLMEGLKKLIKKDRPTTPRSNSSGSTSTPKFASPRQDHPQTVPQRDRSASSGEIATLNTGSESQLRIQNLTSGHPDPELLKANGASESRVRSRTAEPTYQAGQSGWTQRHQGGLRDAFLGRGRRPSALSNDSGAESPTLTRVPSSENANHFAPGRSRLGSRTGSVASTANVIEHVSHEEARRRSGLEAPIVLHNGISVGDLRSEAVRRGSVSSQLPPSIPLRPQRDVPSKAERLLGMSPPSGEGSAVEMEAPDSPQPTPSLMDRFNDSHSIRWNNANPWDTTSRSSHASSSLHSTRARARPFTPTTTQTTTTTTTTSSDTHSLFSNFPGSVTSSVSSYQQSQSSRPGTRGKAPMTPPVDPLAASFALPRVRRNSSGAGLSTKKRFASLFGRGNSGRAPTISSSNISRPVSVAGSTLSDSVESTFSSSTSDVRIKASVSDRTNLCSAARGSIPAMGSDTSSQGGLHEMSTSPSQRSIGSHTGAGESRSPRSPQWQPHTRLYTAPVAGVDASEQVSPMQASESFGKRADATSRNALLRSQAALRENLTKRLDEGMSAVGRRPSLSEHLLSPRGSVLTSARIRRPSADSIYSSRLQQPYKRPTFGLDLQPDAAAAFDSIPSPQILKGPANASKAASLNGSRRSVGSNRNSQSASASMPTAGSSVYSGTDTRPTSQGDHAEFYSTLHERQASGVLGIESHSDHDAVESGVEDSDEAARSASQSAGSLLSSRPVPADAPSSPVDELKTVDLPVPGHAEAESSKMHPSMRWYMNDFPVDPHGNAYDSIYGDMEEYADRMELLEDIQEHPSFSESQSLSVSPQVDNGSFAPVESVAAPRQKWLQLQSNAITQPGAARPSVSSARLGSLEMDAISIQGIPQSVASERSDSISLTSAREEVLENDDDDQLETLAQSSPPSKLQPPPTMPRQTQKAMQPQEDIIDVRAFDWL